MWKYHRKVGFTAWFLKLNKTHTCKRQKCDWVFNTGCYKKTLAEEEQKIFSSIIT